MMAVAEVAMSILPMLRRYIPHLGRNSLGMSRNPRPRKSLIGWKDSQCYARCEPDDYRVGDELDYGSKSEKSQGNEDESSHQGGYGQAL